MVEVKAALCPTQASSTQGEGPSGTGPSGQGAQLLTGTALKATVLGAATRLPCRAGLSAPARCPESRGLGPSPGRLPAPGSQTRAAPAPHPGLLSGFLRTDKPRPGPRWAQPPGTAFVGIFPGENIPAVSLGHVVTECLHFWRRSEIAEIWGI